MYGSWRSAAPWEQLFGVNPRLAWRPVWKADMTEATGGDGSASLVSLFFSIRLMTCLLRLALRYTLESRSRNAWATEILAWASFRSSHYPVLGCCLTKPIESQLFLLLVEVTTFIFISITPFLVLLAKNTCKIIVLSTRPQAGNGSEISLVWLGHSVTDVRTNIHVLSTVYSMYFEGCRKDIVVFECFCSTE
jgi:hypothetical protein